MQRFFLLASLTLAICVASRPVRAQQADARDFELGYFVPNNTVAFNVYARRESATVGNDLSTNAAIMRATHVLKFGNWAMTPIDFLLPMAEATVYRPIAAGSPAKAAIHASGLGDVTWIPTIGYGWLQNPKIHSHTWLAATGYVTLPSGTYDPEQALNIGRNRWMVRPQITVGQRFARAVTLEAFANVAFAGTNSEYRLPAQVIQGAVAATPGAATNPAIAAGVAGALGGDKELTQGMSLGAGLLAGLDLSPSMFLSASYYFAQNAKQEVKGVTFWSPQLEDQHIHTLRVGLGLRVQDFTQVLLQFNQDLKVDNEAPITRGFFVRITHVLVRAAPKPSPSPAPRDEAPAPRDEAPAKEAAEDRDSEEESEDL